jgi:hypothetical protein
MFVIGTLFLHVLRELSARALTELLRICLICFTGALAIAGFAPGLMPIAVRNAAHDLRRKL